MDYTSDMKFRALVATAALLFLASAAQSKPASPKPASAEYEKEIAAWRAERVKGLQSPEGWLTLEGLFWLKDGANTLGSDAGNDIKLPAAAPANLGVVELSGKTVRFTPEAGTGLKLNNQPARTQELKYDESPDKLQIGPLTMIIIQRGERFALRLKNREAKTLREFRGLRYFPANHDLRVVAHWVPYNPPKNIAVPTVLGTAEQMPSPGRAEFTVNGKKVSLEPVLEEPDSKELFFIFKDATAGKETYGAGRFLYTDLSKDGKVVLDFNKAQNPPCAFTPYATCPIPPKQNVLPVAILAGEKSYGHH